ncbi:MAG: hypothetical protein E4H15_06865 [Syntrophobacterales bacterium]|nr:MAG: hypothetical protein E4H15_06865 [Syntrophobacterales bacterium]
MAEEKKQYVGIVVISIAAVITVFLAGCVTTIITRSAYQPYEQTFERKIIIDAITFSISENGFDIAMLNETYGIINTSWRKVTSGTDTAISVLSILGSKGSYSTYSRELSLTFKIDDTGYTVTPKLRKITNTTSKFSSGSSDYIEYPTQDSSEGKIMMKIMREINSALGISDQINWSEKEITVGEDE